MKSIIRFAAIAAFILALPAAAQNMDWNMVGSAGTVDEAAAAAAIYAFTDTNAHFAGANVGADVSIGAFVTIAEGTSIGPRTVIFPNVTIGSGARIGSDGIAPAFRVAKAPAAFAQHTESNTPSRSIPPPILCSASRAAT